MVVPVIAAGVVLPITGGLDKFKVPPSVKLPVVVTVPVKVNPLTVPAPLTLLTVPLLLKVVKSVAARYPSTLVVALAMLMAGVVPPLETTGAVPDTLVTLLLNVVQSADVKSPRFEPDADGILNV